MSCQWVHKLSNNNRSVYIFTTLRHRPSQTLSRCFLCLYITVCCQYYCWKKAESWSICQVGFLIRVLISRSIKYKERKDTFRHKCIFFFVVSIFGNVYLLTAVQLCKMLEQFLVLLPTWTDTHERMFDKFQGLIWSKLQHVKGLLKLIWIWLIHPFAAGERMIESSFF